jgi:iron complex outermembrane receptor protein
VNGEADDYKPTVATIGNLDNQPLQELPVSALVVTRSVLDDQQSRLLSEVARNDASVGEDYAPVGWYQDFMIRGFTLDLASGFKINGLSTAGEQLVALENKESVEFLHGVDADEVGVASGGGLVNYVTRRPAGVSFVNLATDQRGTLYGGIDLGGFFGAQQQFGVRVNLAGERYTLLRPRRGWHAGIRSCGRRLENQPQHLLERRFRIPAFGAEIRRRLPITREYRRPGGCLS